MGDTVKYIVYGLIAWWLLKKFSANTNQFSSGPTQGYRPSQRIG